MYTEKVKYSAIFSVYPQCTCSLTFGSAVITESNGNVVITQLMWPMAIVHWAKEIQGETAWIIQLRLLNSGKFIVVLQHNLFLTRIWSRQKNIYTENLFNSVYPEEQNWNQRHKQRLQCLKIFCLV